MTTRGEAVGTTTSEGVVEEMREKGGGTVIETGDTEMRRRPLGMTDVERKDRVDV